MTSGDFPDTDRPPEPETEGTPASEAPPEEQDWKEKAGSYMEQLVRLQAEFVNYRKRAEKEKAEAIRFGREAILERAAALLDVLESALRHSREAKDVDSFRKGLEMVVGEFVRFLKQEGAEPLKTVGEQFDPHLHEAVEQVEAEDESQNNVIIEELQKGYVSNGRLLRPARVKVAKSAKKEKPS
ncbi:MAG: nucleotide exchange factor GrpE [Elusimicrobia bacterium RIFCSPLOWO2_01_FULL_64_13]|nr:MAG: nucleotide exchange factor GrpE [Elusimicrobia bacterium RIFCSPHIGHO2_01_FULL_64_10]OGR96020.1 MAG: nucleotide exchange factor GrpE [Elusimicrobia bacterium RIFCSPLOWO2_01_FULL_64_13]